MSDWHIPTQQEIEKRSLQTGWRWGLLCMLGSSRHERSMNPWPIRYADGHLFVNNDKLYWTGRESGWSLDGSPHFQDVWAFGPLLPEPPRPGPPA